MLSGWAADLVLMASLLLPNRGMKGITLLWLSLVLVALSILVPGRLVAADSYPGLLIGLLRVPGVICLIIGLIRLRREKQSA